MTQNSPQTPSVAVFCPQSIAPDETYLNHLRTFLCENARLKPFLQEVISLSETWQIFANAREDIASLKQGPRYMKNLSNWILNGDSAAIANIMSGIISLPLLTIIQIGQYFQYLECMEISHTDFLHLVSQGGVAGYCGGLLPAIAIACSRDEAELVQNAAIVMRIALGLGAYGELGDDESIPGPTTIVVRLKYEGQGDEIVKLFPGVSLVTRYENEKSTLTTCCRRIFPLSQTQRPSVLSGQWRYLPHYKLMSGSKDFLLMPCIFEGKSTTQRMQSWSRSSAIYAIVFLLCSFRMHSICKCHCGQTKRASCSRTAL
jgi:hypothetical protein